MSAPAKFLFDTRLDAPTAPPPVAFGEVELLKAAHAAELDRVREEALRQGFEEGRSEAQKELEHELYKKLDTLVEDTQAYQTEIDARLHAARRSSVLLAMTIAKKLAGSLLARYPFEHIEHFFRDSLALLPDKTNLRLHVAPHLAATLQPRLQSLLERNGQENALQIMDDDSIDGVQCRLIWNDGGIEQNPDSIFAEIEKMIETCLYSEDPQSALPCATTEPVAPNSTTIETMSGDIALADNNARAI